MNLAMRLVKNLLVQTKKLSEWLPIVSKLLSLKQCPQDSSKDSQTDSEAIEL